VHPTPPPSPLRVVIVTGARDCGKTTALVEAVEELKRLGHRVAGFVQPAERHDDEKNAYFVRDVATGEEAPLARKLALGRGLAGTRFEFDPAGFALARRALARVASGDVLVVDEMGPLELSGEGHMQPVRVALATPGLAGAVVCIRDHLLPPLRQVLGIEIAVVVDTRDHGRDASQAIVAALCGR